jgi:hypothetical protein
MTVKSYDYISSFLVNAFADTISMAMLCSLGKKQLDVTKKKGRKEVANFKVMFQILPGDTKQTTETRVVDFERRMEKEAAMLVTQCMNLQRDATFC